MHSSIKTPTLHIVLYQSCLSVHPIGLLMSTQTRLNLMDCHHVHASAFYDHISSGRNLDPLTFLTSFCQNCTATQNTSNSIQSIIIQSSTLIKWPKK